MNFIYLIDLANLTIPMIVFLAIASLVFGILIGYLINSKYKNQVVEIERDRAKLTTQISGLESELEESRLARSNADGEISLLTNRVRDREARVKETEGKLALLQKKMEEADAKLAANASAENPKSLDVETTYIERQTSAPKTTSPLTSTKKIIQEEPPKVVESVTSNVPPAAKMEQKKSKDKSGKKSNGEKAKSDKTPSDKKATGKRGRPKGAKNKNTKDKVVSDKPTGKRGRPPGSKNKTTSTANAEKATTSTTKGKRGRPKGAKNKTTTTATSVATPTVSKGRGRPPGSKNKTTTAGSSTITSKAGGKTKETRGRKKDDLKLIEGIGPKMEEALRNGGVRTFAKMSKTPADKLSKILVKANSRYAMAVTETWPEQAKLAADGAFDKLKTLQDSLNGGKK